MTNKRFLDNELTNTEHEFVRVTLANSKDVLPGITVINAGGSFGDDAVIGVRQAVVILDELVAKNEINEAQKVLLEACELTIQDINNWYHYHKEY